jgi:hypothetical protein
MDENAIVEQQQLANVTAPTTFTQAVDEAKISVIKEAATEDEKFVADFKESLKKATMKLAEVEGEKAELEKQNIAYHQELLETQQQLNLQKQAEDEWHNKQKRREFHFSGVQAIMDFVGIKSAMNLALLYFLTAVLLPFFLASKLFKGTIGALIAGAEDSSRPKAVKGFLWTLLAIIVTSGTAIAIYLLLQFMKII